ncbi:MAG: hypothetical protein ABH865_03815 [Candidatus Omnitrophota bacterium]|nr:hypothetical protein [Candidatus Omnitrophota bacterium]
MFDNFRYREYVCKKAEARESLCRRCGACCGAHEDACRHLMPETNGTYSCAVYPGRFGVQETVSGKKFTCVPIGEILDQNWFGDRDCAYKQIMQMPWLVHGKRLPSQEKLISHRS